MGAKSMTVTLVACVSQKLDHPAPAKDLYISQWFTRARHYAELISDRWYILSAKYGLLEPNQLIEPYNLTLNTMRKAERVTWATGVWLQILRQEHPSETILMLAGKHYRDPLAGYLKSKGYTVNVPMEGLGIGQ